VKLIVTEIVGQPAPQDPVVAPENGVIAPSTETPTTDNNPISVHDEPVADTLTKTAPDTLWVFVGAITVTILLLVISFLMIHRKKKAGK
jgi:hypothetical protein